jgi:hypothetical protein
MFVVPSEAAARALILADLLEAGNIVEPKRQRVFAAIDGNASESKNVDNRAETRVVAGRRMERSPQPRSRSLSH